MKLPPVEIPADDAPPPLPLRELVARLRNLVSQANLETVARGIGCHQGTLGKMLAGKQRWSDALVAKATEYLRLRAIRDADEAAGLVGRTVPTSVSRTIADVCTVCQVQHAIGEVRGSAAVGKTIGALLYCRSNPAAIYIHASARVNTPIRMLEELWHLAGFRYVNAAARSRSKRPGTGGRANRGKWQRRPAHRSPTVKAQYDQIVEDWRVGEGQTSARVVLIDDAHLLGDRTLELLRTVHDDTGVGLVLVGTTNLLRLQAACGAGQMYEQVVSRVAIRRTILSPPAADVAAIAKAHMPPGRDLTAAAREYLLAVAAGFGGNRAVRWHVQLAFGLPRSGPKDGEALDRRHLVEAHKMLAGDGDPV